MLDTADRFAIYELLALYGHIIDERQWSRIDELFTPEGVFDMSALGFAPAEGRAAIQSLWARKDAGHPAAHHGTNIVISEDADGTVRVISKALGVGHKGRVGSATYKDTLQKTPGGWRFATRTVFTRETSSTRNAAAGPAEGAKDKP